MKVFEKIIKVTKDDLDQLNHVNNVRYVQWVQDIAELHWLNNASKNITDNYFWVMMSHHIDYKSQAVLGDDINLKTFVIKSEGLISIRKVEIFNLSTNKLAAASETKWCFMNANTKRPARIPEEVISLF